jgi:hypothetical protein
MTAASLFLVKVKALNRISAPHRSKDEHRTDAETTPNI